MEVGKGEGPSHTEKGFANSSYYYYVAGKLGVTGLGGQIGMADVFVCLNPSNKMSQTVAFKKKMKLIS